MFIYCISPYKKIECKFIKVGICDDITLLKSRYTTYYGNSCRYYYVKVINRNEENNIHKKLKELGLHLENEIFLLNKEYDFYFYVQILKEFEIIDFENKPIKKIINKDTYILKRNHMFEFIIHIYDKFLVANNKIKLYYSKKEEIDKIWKLYLTFCINIKQYYESKSILKKNIQSMVYCDNPINHKNYKIEFKINEIIITNLKYINNKYIRCRNKLKIIILYEYIKIKRKKYDEIISYVKYMINIPLHENLIQNIVKNISKNKDQEKNKINKTLNIVEKINILNYNNHKNVENIKNKLVNKNYYKKKYIIEYKNLCKIIKIKVINENQNYFKHLTKIEKDINKCIDYKLNRYLKREDIIFIVADIKKILDMLEEIINIKIVIMYVTQLFNCIYESKYQNPLFIIFKNQLLKEIQQKRELY